MESKYYTPSIEEFHVGFEFQGLNTASNYPKKDTWISFELGLGLGEQWSRIEDYINNNQIRVKYLDKEDIKSLGGYWDGNGYRFKRNYNAQYIRIVFYENKEYPKENILIHSRICRNLEKYTDYNAVFHDMRIFYGYIKNKSELKVLLKQLGIDA